MERGYDDEPAACNTQTCQEMCQEKTEDRIVRHTLFLARHSRRVPFGSWRPKRIHRTKPKLWAMMLGNQMQAISGRGLAFFKRDEEQAHLWGCPYEWPHAAIVQDLGSDGNSAYHSLERLYVLNTDQYNDQSHGCTCDWDLALEPAAPRSCG